MGFGPSFHILAQPDDTTCGPTCLHSVYAYYGDHVPLDELIREVPSLATGGTLAVMLASHALKRGYKASIYTYNLHIFDSSWFGEGVDIRGKLEEQAAVKNDDKLRFATRQYVEFLDLGGVLRFRELNPQLITEFLTAGRPILTGLSATYLYGCSREVYTDRAYFDDIRGIPVGHFVVLLDYDAATGQVLVADPVHDNPKFGGHYYSTGIQRVLGAILLGIVTYDANLLILEPGKPAE